MEKTEPSCPVGGNVNKRSEIELFVVRWMDLESVIKSEVSEKEKNKYHMLTHVYGILKKKKSHEEPRDRTGIEMQTY